MRWHPTLGIRGVGLALLAAVGLTPAVGQAADDRLLPSRQPVLLDGAGGVVGPVHIGLDVNGTGLDMYALVSLRVAGRVLLLQATPQALKASPGTDLSRLGFETADCSGPPWFMGPLFPFPLVFAEVAPGPDRTLWVPDGPPAVANIISTLQPTDSNPCQAEPGGFLQMQRAIQTLDLKSFPPPFTIR